MFHGNFDRFYYPTREFSEHFRAYSVAMLPGNDRPEVTFGGKIILPPSALEKLTSYNITYPMLFSIKNQAQRKETHAGVLEFIAPEGRVYLPPWMMNTLLLKEGDLIQLKNVTLPLGTFVKIQPQNVDFLEITDPKAVLENAFRGFATLTVGDMLAFKYGGKVFEIEVLEVKPIEDAKGISIIETDLSVDFAPPIGYVEPSSYASSYKMSRETSMLGTTPTLQEFIVPDKDAFKVFNGPGNRLKKTSILSKQLNTPEDEPAASTLRQDGLPISSSANTENIVPAVLNLPEGRLFFGYPIKQKKKQGEETPSLDLGAGNTLRASRSKK